MIGDIVLSGQGLHECLFPGTAQRRLMGQKVRRFYAFFSPKGVVVCPFVEYYRYPVCSDKAMEMLVAPHGQRELCAIGLLHHTRNTSGRHSP